MYFSILKYNLFLLLIALNCFSQAHIKGTFNKCTSQEARDCLNRLLEPKLKNENSVDGKKRVIESLEECINIKLRYYSKSYLIKSILESILFSTTCIMTGYLALEEIKLNGMTVRALLLINGNLLSLHFSSKFIAKNLNCIHIKHNLMMLQESLKAYRMEHSI